MGFDEAALKTMADLSWFKSNYNIDTENVFSLFDAMSHNNWMFKGHSYSVDGDILVTKKSEYDYLWFEQTDADNKIIGVTNCNYGARIKILDERERN